MREEFTKEEEGKGAVYHERVSRKEVHLCGIIKRKKEGGKTLKTEGKPSASETKGGRRIGIV